MNLPRRIEIFQDPNRSLAQLLAEKHRRGSTKALSLKKVKEDKNAFYSAVTTKDKVKLD